MCGITAGISQRDVAPILLEGLKRLEYRGYDSAGIATINSQEQLCRLRVCGKVSMLEGALEASPQPGHLGVAHTRWATHGKPSEDNAHPHMHDDVIALVHNGIIENFQEIKNCLQDRDGAIFHSETDSEVIVKLLAKTLETTKDLFSAVRESLGELKGAYALAVVSKLYPDRLIAARKGSPLVIGVGFSEHFLASDPLALLPVTQQFVVLEEGDVAEIYQDQYRIVNSQGEVVIRPVRKLDLHDQWSTRGEYRHFMQKEIFEQTTAVNNALEGRVFENQIDAGVFGASAKTVFSQTKQVHIVACGTSFYAAMVAKYWIESIVGLPCQVEIASEMRYRNIAKSPDTLLVAISQSGETADTLAAFMNTEHNHWLARLAICNVPESTLVREADLVLLTHAGPEIGVATTKGFTTQLVGLLMLTYCLARHTSGANELYVEIVPMLRKLPHLVEDYLGLDGEIEKLASLFEEKIHALFLGRGEHYPIALEGALKLKEISYIHAEGYPAGELKHGPLALVDKYMPVVALVPKNGLLEKMNSNLLLAAYFL